MLRKVGGVANGCGSCVITGEGRQHWLIYRLENKRELQSLTVLSGLNESAPSLLVQPAVVLSSSQRSLLSPRSGSFLSVLSYRLHF